MKEKKLSPFPYFGGKFYSINEILSFFPQHVHYVEVFGGSGKLLLNKFRSKLETYNDIYDRVVVFFNILRDRPQELIERLQVTPYARKEFIKSLLWDGKEDGIEIARKFFIQCVQSRGERSGIISSNGNWGYSVNKDAIATSRWLYNIKNLASVANRLQGVQIENLCFRQLIPKYDSPYTFFYCDPPYLIESRLKQESSYIYEFTKQDHSDLGEILHTIKGKAIVSGYSHPFIDDLYKDWHKVTFPEKAVYVSRCRNGTKKKRSECIWLNFCPDDTFGW